MPIKSFLARRNARRGFFRRKGKTHIASSVVIRRPVSWRTRLLWGGLSAMVALLAGAGLFVAGQYSAGHASIDSLLRLRELGEDNARLHGRVGELTEALASTTTQLHIEQGARKTLEAQVAGLEAERVRLNRDLAVFDNLFPSNGVDGQPAIRGFEIEPVGAGNAQAWRYRLLIMRAGRTLDDFVGEFRLQVRYRLDGREITAQNPEHGKLVEALRFGRYQRLEGRFQAPAGAKLLGAVARVVENGKPVAESVHQP